MLLLLAPYFQSEGLKWKHCLRLHIRDRSSLLLLQLLFFLDAAASVVSAIAPVAVVAAIFLPLFLFFFCCSSSACCWYFQNNEKLIFLLYIFFVAVHIDAMVGVVLPSLAAGFLSDMLLGRRACLLPNIKTVRGLVRIFHRFRCCWASLWCRVLTEECFTYVPRSEVGSMIFYKKAYFFPAHQNIGDFWKTLATHTCLENKVPVSNAWFT